jgi:hypothetical protein
MFDIGVFVERMEAEERRGGGAEEQRSRGTAS